MTRGPVTEADRLGGVLRVLTLAVLAVAPLAIGSVVAEAYVPLLSLVALAGLVSWVRARIARTLGEPVPLVPGRYLLLAAHVLVLVQLIPLPLPLLRIVSPGSHRAWTIHQLLPSDSWQTISVSPGDTVFGLLHFAAYTLLYGLVVREFGSRRWQRRLGYTVVFTGVVASLVGLVQMGAGTHAIYGIIRFDGDWAVFGPYVNRNHFAGYIVMAIPLALGFSTEAVAELRRTWSRIGWVSLGRDVGGAVLRRWSETLVLVAGLVASTSRGGFMAFGLSALCLPFLSKQKKTAALVVALLAGGTVYWLGVGPIVHGFVSRGLKASRVDIWADMLPMVRDFPLLGCGLHAFGVGYRDYQTIWRDHWVGQAHNEYLQALIDTGALGAALFVGFMALVLSRAFRAARRGAFEVGLFGALLALSFHNLVDFQFQIEANAMTWVALAGLAVRASVTRHA